MLDSGQEHEALHVPPFVPASRNPDAHRALTRGGFALLSNSALTSALGVAYWLVAAHLMPSADVGRGSSLLSALWTVSALAQLNYARTLPGLLPGARGGARRLLARVYGRVICASIAAGLAFGLAALRLDGEFRYLLAVPLFTLLFTLLVPVYSIFSLEDAVLATIRRTSVIPFENATFGVLKIALLLGLVFAHAMPDSIVIISSWALPLLFIVTPINIYLFGRAVPQASGLLPGTQQRDGTWVRYDFLGYLLWLLGTLPLPVIVITVLGPVQTAAFYVPFTIATSIDVLSLNLGNTLTAEMSRARGRFDAATTLFVWRAWAVIGALSVFLIAAAPYVLDLFGAQYRAGGTAVFRILMLAALPRSVLFFCIAATRARAAAGLDRTRGALILALQSVGCVTTLLVALTTMPHLGAAGMALGWCAASFAGAAAAAITVRPPAPRPAVRARHRLSA